MSMKITSVYIFLSIFIFSISARTEDAGRRWSISAGAKTRRVEYSFDSRGLDNWQDYITPLQSRGSTEIYDGNGTIQYDDGSISPAWPGVGQEYEFPNTYINGGTRVVEYHSTEYSYPSGTVSIDKPIEKKENVSPFLKARYIITKTQSASVGVSLLGGVCKQSAGKRMSVNHTVTQKRTVYEFLYEGTLDSSGDGGYVLYNPEQATSANDDWINANFDFDPNYPQRNVVSQDTVTTGTLNGMMDAEVDIYWYELTLGLDWSKTLFNRLDLFALVGPTAHVLDWEMEHNTTWTIAGDKSPVTTTHANDSGTKTLVGGVAELGINLYLDSDRRYFIEASGEYLYLEDVTLHAGAASVEIDPESWGGKLGIGMRL